MKFLANPIIFFVFQTNFSFFPLKCKNVFWIDFFVFFPCFKNGFCVDIVNDDLSSCFQYYYALTQWTASEVNQKLTGRKEELFLNGKIISKSFQ